MRAKAVHNIKVSHNFHETHQTTAEDGAITVHEQCRSCGVEQSTVDLTTVRGPDLEGAPTAETVAYWRDFSDKVKKGLQALDAMRDGLLEGTQYSSIDDLANYLDRRYQGVVDGRRLPFGQLNKWIRSHNRKRQLKVLLVHKQSLVCNRCDNIFLSRQLTIDHIDHNRSNSKLTNLQLLCERCAGEKADKSPGPNDISPFDYEGEACLHPITCVQLNALIEAGYKAQNAVSL